MLAERHFWSTTLLVVALEFVARPAGAESAAEQPQPKAGVVTQEFHEPDAGTTLHWDLLRVPELATRLALTPLFPLITVAEQTRLNLRLYDTLSNYERTSILLPLVTAYTKDGVGVGVLYGHSDAFGEGESISFYALTTNNRDVNVTGSYSEGVALLDGRSIGLGFEYELDHNERYHGIGPRTELEDLRALEFRDLALMLDIDVGGPNTLFTTGLGSELTLGYLRQQLGPGNISGTPPVQQDDPQVPAPPGFERPIDYLNVGWSFSFDQRDTLGRTERGVYLGSALSATSDMNAQNLNAATALLTGSYFLPLAPRHRVLVLTVGGAATTPLGEASEVPLHQLVSLGRSSNLRGYPTRRFRDRTGWWTNLEYRYPVFDYQDSGAGLSATLFIDAGAVAPSVLKFTESPVRYSPGIGIRAEAPSAFVFRAQLAYSNEGIEAGISMNELYDLP